MEPRLSEEDRLESLKYNEETITSFGTDFDGVIDFYTKWGSTYDDQLGKLYKGPAYGADAIAHHLGGNTDALILDIGSGTGLVAERLHEYGFKNIEGVEPSAGMREKASKKNLYKEIYDCFFTDNVACLNSNTYDAVIGTGVLAAGHIQPSAMFEVIRCLKPGGYAVFISGTKRLKNCPMRDMLNKLEKDGKWKLIEEKEQPNFFLDQSGTLFVFSKSVI